MAIVHIRHKCISIARDCARKNSTSRLNGRSVFIKRYYGSYHIIAVEVSALQRSCRTLFAEAQKMASHEMKKWNRRRYWYRQSKRHNINGAHRMAVSFFYKLLRENPKGLQNMDDHSSNSLKPSASHLVQTLLYRPGHASLERRSSLPLSVPIVTAYSASCSNPQYPD